MKYLLIALVLMSQSVLASTITYTWTNATTDVNGVSISPSDIAGVTVQCGALPGVYELVSPWTMYLPSVAGVPITSTTVAWTNTNVSTLYCSMNTTNLSGIVGPDSAEISFDPNATGVTAVIGAPTGFTSTVSP